MFLRKSGLGLLVGLPLAPLLHIVLQIPTAMPLRVGAVQVLKKEASADGN